MAGIKAGLGCLGLLLMGLGCSTGGVPSNDLSPFRVMTYNIHHGEGVDGKFDLERIAGLIKAEQADVVALQEVDRGVARTKKMDLPAELSRLTGMTCLFSNNFHYQGGEYGNALLTRFPVVSQTNLHYRMLHTNEQRGSLLAQLSVGRRNLVVVSTHLDFRPAHEERLENIRQMKEWLRSFGATPIIICGDFNATPGSPTHQAMKEEFKDAWNEISKEPGYTFSSKEPRKRIDYVFFRGAQLIPVRAWSPSSEASDHLPLVVEFKWR